MWKMDAKKCLSFITSAKEVHVTFLLWLVCLLAGQLEKLYTDSHEIFLERLALGLETID